MTIDSEKNGEDRFREVWSVHEFARQYRLDRLEESRLKMLHGPFVAAQELLASRRQTSVW